MLVVNTQHAKIKCSNLGSHATTILYCNIVEMLKTKTYFHFISLIWHRKSGEKESESESDRALAFECCLVFYFMASIGCICIQDFQNPTQLISRTGIIWLSIVGKHIVPIVFSIITTTIMAHLIKKMKIHISRRVLHKLEIRKLIIKSWINLVSDSWIHSYRKLCTISWKSVETSFNINCSLTD